MVVNGRDSAGSSSRGVGQQLSFEDIPCPTKRAWRQIGHYKGWAGYVAFKIQDCASSARRGKRPVFEERIGAQGRTAFPTTQLFYTE